MWLMLKSFFILEYFGICLKLTHTINNLIKKNNKIFSLNRFIQSLKIYIYI